MGAELFNPPLLQTHTHTQRTKVVEGQERVNEKDFKRLIERDLFLESKPSPSAITTTDTESSKGHRQMNGGTGKKSERVNVYWIRKYYGYTEYLLD